MVKAPADTICYEYNSMDNPSAAQATTPENYQQNPLSCGEESFTLCGICFDETQFPLVNGLPDFDGQPLLDSLVSANRGNLAADGQKIFANAPNDDKWVEFHFRE